MSDDPAFPGVRSAAEIRKESLERRQRLPASGVSRLSQAITARFIEALPVPASGLRVALYRAMPGEPDLSSLQYPECPPDRLDLIFLPGVAFGTNER